ncbi:MAG: hypothetical protein HY332_18330, partial [Chloroflexi bacterium]|nr:hypothetical protein [Chloroflexota bacterium]
RRLAVLFGFAGAEHATLTVVDTRNGTLVVTGAGSAISSAAGVMSVADWTIPAGDDAYSLDRIDDPALGSGGEIRATLRLRDRSEATATVRLALFDEQPYLTYQLTLENWPLPDTRPDDTPTPIRLDYLSASGAAFVAGESMRYFADASYVREAELEDDGLWRNVRLGIGSPAVIWGSARPGAIVLAMLGEQRLPAWLVLRRDPGRAAAAAGISQPMLVPDEAAAPATKIAMAAKSAGTDATPTSLAGPRLLLEVTDTPDLRAALANYRRISEALYPPAPLPDWVRYQWGSWWVYGSGVDEERMRQHIDLISTYLGDLGPWHILIDGGWQDLGWDGSGDLRRANPERFPSGLRALVDYAHARGIRVIVLYSAVYAHDGTGFGEWLAQPRLITEHPEWFRRLAPPDSPSSSYMFDYSSPAARRYLAGVLATYVVDHDADGVKIDGLGDVEGQLIPFSERTINFSDRWMLTPVVDIYRMVAKTVLAAKPDAFIESGWVNPPVAHQYAHSFRYGDELNRSDNEYPFPGLLQHFRYGAIQRALLNQRPNIGAIYGGFNTPVADQWLGAALALGAQVSLGSDLNFLTPEGFAALRAMLVHQRPFAGTTRIGPEHYGLRPAWAATTIGGLTFVGLANEQPDTQRIEVPLSEVLPAGARDTGGTPGTGGGDYLAYDVFQNRFARVEGVLAADVPAHGLALIVLRRTPGVVWTTSSYSETTSSAGWHVYVRGPANVQGRLQFHLPRTAPSTAPGAAPRAAPGAVLLDGRRLGPLTPDAPEGHDYDPATGVLTLRYRHAGLATDAASQSPVRVIDVLR